MDRRRVIGLLVTGTAGLCVGNPFGGPSLLDAQDRPANGPPLLPLFPLDLVLLPETNLPLHIFEERYKEMIHDCMENNSEFGMLAVEDDKVKNIGCTASISEVAARFDDGRLNILVRGRRRFEVTDLDQEKSYLRGQVHFIDDEAVEPAGEELRKHGVELLNRLIELADIPAQQFQDVPSYMDSQLSYRLMAATPADLDWKQNLLELRSEPERLDRVISYLDMLIEYFGKNPDRQRAVPKDIA
jgi:Lon protease-like protein